MNDYPRDLFGYGGTPPHAQWPGNARIAVNFVVNIEEGGEHNVLLGDSHSEYHLSETPTQPLMGTRNLIINLSSSMAAGQGSGASCGCSGNVTFTLPRSQSAWH